MIIQQFIDSKPEEFIFECAKELYAGNQKTRLNILTNQIKSELNISYFDAFKIAEDGIIKAVLNRYIFQTKNYYVFDDR
jgi:hypothetical protein